MMGTGPTSLRLGLAIGLASLSVGANALTIIRNFAGGTASTNVAGGGSLTAIFNAAADCWQHHILDTHTVTLTYSWGALGSGILGQHTLGSQGGVPNRETAGTIQFTNVAGVAWFMDNTPTDAFEYSTYTENFANLGGGNMSVGRRFIGPNATAAGRYDMFSVAFHEIGHALGLSSANTSFQAENADGDIDITGPRPFAGASIPTISGAHLNLANSLMFPSSSPGQRVIASHADIVSNAQISQFTNLDLTRCMVPEPATIALLGLGMAAAATRRRRK